jgi:hypothetical protein
LEGFFNPQATKAVENYNHEREMILDQVNLALFSTVTVKEPTTEIVINKELKEMEKIGVWEIIDEKDILIN